MITNNHIPTKSIILNWDFVAPIQPTWDVVSRRDLNNGLGWDTGFITAKHNLTCYIFMPDYPKEMLQAPPTATLLLATVPDDSGMFDPLDGSARTFNGRIIVGSGYVMCTHGVWFMRHDYTTPLMRRRGIQLDLIKNRLNYALSKNAKEIRAWVNKGGQSQRNYERIGFVCTGVKTGTDYVVMRYVKP